MGGLTTFGFLVGFRASHGNPKPSLLEVISPIFWGVKPSFFMGTWGPREGDICLFSFWGNFQILLSDMFAQLAARLLKVIRPFFWSIFSS